MSRLSHRNSPINFCDLLLTAKSFSHVSNMHLKKIVKCNTITPKYCLLVHSLSACTGKGSFEGSVKWKSNRRI